MLPEQHFLVLKTNVVSLVCKRLALWTMSHRFLTSRDLFLKATKELNIIGLHKTEEQLIQKQINSALSNRSKDQRYRVAISLIKVVGSCGRRGFGFCYIPEGEVIQVRAANIQLVKTGGVQYI